MGFEPTRAEHIGLAVQRLNHSATSSVDEPKTNIVSSCIKHVLEPYVQSVVTVWFYMMKSGQGTDAFQKTRVATNRTNRPFRNSLVPLFQNESKCETFHMKMSSACSFIFIQIKVIFITMVSHLDSLSNRGTRKLGNGIFGLQFFVLKYLEIRQRSRHQYVYIMNTIIHSCLIRNFFPVFNFISH